VIRDIYAAMMSKNPIVLGVTGHRNFTTDDPAITALTEKECNRIRRNYPQADYLLLSGLAEGADRLVAQVAQKTLGAKLLAINPLPRDLYEKDFTDQASRLEYAGLLGQAKMQIDAPLLAERAEIADYGEPRNHQYAWQGAFIAKRAQILIAIWDGAPAKGTGGTAQVVEWFLSGKTPAYYNISKAKRITGVTGVARELIHINPVTRSVQATPAKAAV